MFSIQVVSLEGVVLHVLGILIKIRSRCIPTIQVGTHQSRKNVQKPEEFVGFLMIRDVYWTNKLPALSSFHCIDRHLLKLVTIQRLTRRQSAGVTLLWCFIANKMKMETYSVLLWTTFWNKDSHLFAFWLALISCYKSFTAFIFFPEHVYTFSEDSKGISLDYQWLIQHDIYPDRPRSSSKKDSLTSKNKQINGGIVLIELHEWKRKGNHWRMWALLMDLVLSINF